jgi:hypothetical protein
MLRSASQRWRFKTPLALATLGICFTRVTFIGHCLFLNGEAENGNLSIVNLEQVRRLCSCRSADWHGDTIGRTIEPIVHFHGIRRVATLHTALENLEKYLLPVNISICRINTPPASTGFCKMMTLMQYVNETDGLRQSYLMYRNMTFRSKPDQPKLLVRCDFQV